MSSISAMWCSATGGDTLGSPVMFNLGDSAGALANYRKAVAIGQEIYDADPNDTTAKFDLATGLQRMGMIDVPASGMAESIAALQRSAAMLESIVANDPKNISRKRMLALSLEYLGHRLQSLGRYHEAMANYQKSLTLAEGFLAPNPKDHSGLSQALASGRGLATATALAGDRTAALRIIKQTLTRAEASVPNDPRGGQRHVAETSSEQGLIYEIFARHDLPAQKTQDWEAARSLLTRSVSLLQALPGGGKLASIEATDLENAQKRLVEANKHLPPAHPAHP